VLQDNALQDNAPINAASFEREGDRNVDDHMFEIDSTVPTFRP